MKNVFNPLRSVGDFVNRNNVTNLVQSTMKRGRYRADYSRARSFNARSMHRDSSYDDDDANELPVVAGWSGRVRVEHYSGIW